MYLESQEARDRLIPGSGEVGGVYLCLVRTSREKSGFGSTLSEWALEQAQRAHASEWC